MTTHETLEVLSRLEQQIIDPATRHSPEALDALLSDDFLEFAASGRVYRKDSVIAALTAQDFVPETTNEGYELRPLAEGVILLTYRNVGRPGGVPDSLRSSIWKLAGDRWQIVFHQGTRTPSTA